MESEGPPTEEQTGAGESNVVRFPRDWLGPREELVPFGPRAGRAAGADEARRDAADDSARGLGAAPPPAAAAGLDAAPPPPAASGLGAAPPPSAASAPSAADFWGEASASVQEPLQGPSHPLVPPERTGAPPVVHPRRARLRPRWPRRVSHRVRGTSDAGEIGRRRWFVAAAVSAVFVVGVGFAVVGRVGGGVTHRALSGGSSLTAAHHLARDLHGVAAGVQTIANAKVRISPPRNAARHRNPGRAAPAHSATVLAVSTPVHSSASSAARRSAVTASPTITTSSAAAGGGSTAAGTGSTSAGGGSTTGGGVSSASESADKRSPPPGPVGRGAPFGPGHLG